MNITGINVILYLRVSTDEQAEKGFSLDYQEESLRRYCSIKGYNILAVYREDHSAKDFNRPEWKKLMTFVRSNKKSIHQLLFVKWDRFSRNIEHAFAILGQFDSMGIEVNASEQLLDASNPDNRLILSMYLAMGETERLKISSRTKDGTHQAKKEGYYTGKAPHGYDNVRDANKKSTLRPNKDGYFITKAFLEIAKGVEPIDTIRKKLQDEGMKIAKQTFYEAIANPTYAGKISVPEYKKEPAFLAEGKHKALIDFDTFRKVQAIRQGRRWHKVVLTQRNPNFPLRSYFICSVCGEHITGSTSRGRNGTYYAYYHCKTECPTRVSQKQAHGMFADKLGNMILKPNMKELFANHLIEVNRKNEGGKKEEIEKKQVERQAVQNRIEEIEDRLANKDISIEVFNSMLRRYQRNLMELSSDIEAVSVGEDSIAEFIDDGLNMLVHSRQLYKEDEYDSTRIIAGALFDEKIPLSNDGLRNIKTNDVYEYFSFEDWGLGLSKKAQAAKISSLYGNVPGAGVEPARFPTGV
jgi:site-specific DNA recombinase